MKVIQVNPRYDLRVVIEVSVVRLVLFASPNWFSPAGFHYASYSSSAVLDFVLA